MESEIVSMSGYNLGGVIPDNSNTISVQLSPGELFAPVETMEKLYPVEFCSFINNPQQIGFRYMWE